MVPNPYRVLRRRVDVARDAARGIDEVVTLDLEPVDTPLEPPMPGQFMMVWAPGIGEVPISVSTLGDSTSGASTTGVSTVGVTIRAVGATTAALCASVAGDPVGLRGPFGRGWAQIDPDRFAVVVAGGIGLAPVRLHLESLLAARRANADNKVVLIVAARSPAEILYPEQLEDWSRHFDVHLTVDRPSRGWAGEVGLVTSTMARIGFGPDAAAALCGPEVMMRIVAADLVAAGIEPDAVEVSLERSMACAVAHCGRCQLGPVMLCRDGPVLQWSEAAALMGVRRW
jgi:NAD(P)H-flavin reductase